MERRTDSIARWREIVEQQRGSGLTITAFCRRMGVAQASFFAWRRKLRAGVSLRGLGEMFAEVKVAPQPATGSSAIELRLSNGRCVLVRAGFDQRTLLELVATLEAVR